LQITHGIKAWLSLPTTFITGSLLIG